MENIRHGINRRAAHNAYEDGYQSGINWPDKWEDHKPGGPFVYSKGEFRDQSIAEKKAWLEGWEDGHEQKLLDKRSKP